MTSSPLLHGQKTDTALDLITERLYFVLPLTPRQIEWLNTVIYNRYPFWINYWSFTHLAWGVIWALLQRFTGSLGKQLFSFRNLMIFHALFEIWELWAGGYIGPGQIRRLNFAELVDISMDTLFTIFGYFISSLVINAGHRFNFLSM
jgi:hypothetical protein